MIWCSLEACRNFGTPADDPIRWKSWFEERGFESVTEEVYKVPLSPWPTDKRLKLIGIWWQYLLLNYSDSMMLRPFTKGLGWSEAQVLVLSALFKRDLRNPDIHAYFEFYVVYGRKPKDLAH
ncbi:hypothetical protein CDD83_9344 [Cordyceps sp. RAO-2017]|nr:hypothetical protein CDD83_9344 [Cordyceps sp. RAO-2017]